MKICVYGVSRKERPYFEEARARWGLQLELHEEKPCLENAHLARGCTCVSILSIPAPAPLLELSDLVSEIRSVKHPYDKGIPAIRGIDF